MREVTMKNLNVLMWIGLALLGAPGCGFQNESEQASAPVAPPEAWVETLLSAPGARLAVKSLSPEVQRSHKERFQAPELDEMRSDASGAFTLYRLRDIPAGLEGARNVVFVQPKVFVYGTAQGGNVLQLASADGRTMSLTFPIAFVDGMRATLPSHEGTRAVTLPSPLQIPDQAALKADLRSQLGAEPKVMALTTCPRQMTLLYVRGGEVRRLPLVPTVSIRNRCPINEFFTVTVKSTAAEIMDLVQNGITDGLGVQIQADFQVQYRDPVAFYSLQLDPVAVYAELRRKFIDLPFGGSGDPTVYFAFQLIEPLEEMLRNLVERTGTAATWVPYFQGVQTLLDTFFDPVDPEGGCREPNRCFRLRPEWQVSLDEPVELQWIENQTLAATRIIPTVTFVRGLRVSNRMSCKAAGTVYAPF